MSRVLRVLSAVVLTAGGMLVAASPASATTTLAACLLHSYATSTYSPPLTNTEKLTDIEVEMHLECQAASAGVTSGGFTQTILGAPYSCANLIGTSTLTFQITWDNGQTSTLVGDFTGSVAVALLINEGHGTVEQGLFEGASFIYARKALAPEVASCLAGPGTVESSSGPVVLTILSA